MSKKVLIGVGILTIISIAIFLSFFNETSDIGSKNNPKTNYDDTTWLEIIVQGESGEGVKLTDKKLNILVGISSYDPSKIGKCPYAEIEIKGCGVDYRGHTDENGYAAIPVNFTQKGILTITVKCDRYEKTIKVRVE
ncbi:hypothetical protein [Thermococcus paralvinellae]|uniref:Uncharacterized protein n=1 Tax=Thermococcus paralvinellae TaxID=582419 RepID=W0I7R7_9EURY|nr:hypothetical protein [Thermococcus paralvinellae]AHF80802.1 Hypothetical protein TES1_1424 [Thermococcus paralvinellae]